MGINGGSSDRSLWHDIVSSLIHQIDKLGFATHGSADWVRIPNEGIYKFKNDFSAIKAEESVYLAGIEIPEVRVQNLKPERWDESGTMASFSANSEVAALRDFFRKNARGIRGPSGGKSKEMPPRPPVLSDPPEATKLTLMTEAAYIRALVRIREETTDYHRWTTGAKGRLYWKKTPVRTGSEVIKIKGEIKIEGDGDAGLLDKDTEPASKETGASSGNANERTVWSKSDLLRYTVNSHPALARALTRILPGPNGKEKVRQYMQEAAPKVAAEFERNTGRKVMGVSVHFDSDTPHWNFWHCGIERVIYKISEKGKDRARYRRTAFNLNAAGPGLLAWDRVRRSFARQNMDFRLTCKWTQKELDDAESACKKRQGRRPGDWVVNEMADKVLEELLVKGGWHEHVEVGFTEFVANEMSRYSAGMAGRGAKNLKNVADVMQLHDMQDLAGTLLDLQQKFKKSQQAELQIEKELNGLRRLRELVLRFLDRLVSTGKILKLLGLVGRQAAVTFGLIAKEVGRELPGQDQDKNSPEH